MGASNARSWIIIVLFVWLVAFVLLIVLLVLLTRKLGGSNAE